MQVKTQTHLAMLRDLLTYRQSDLRAEVHAAGLARRERVADPTEVTDRKQEADAVQTGATADFQEERDRAELRLVEAALHRLAAGTYGDCSDCGDSIPMQRLLAQPAAERCAPCQAKQEAHLGH